MTSSHRFPLLVLLLAYAALLEPARPVAAQPLASDVEARLQRISLALQARQGSDPLPAHLDGALARGFANGPRGGFANGAYRGFVNNHRYYGGPSRGFINGRGYYGGGFVNARPRGGSFVNW